MQLGTLVKLVCVLMLEPVVTGLSVLMSRQSPDGPHKAPKIRYSRLVPLFILAFLALAAINSLGLVPDALDRPVHMASGFFTVLAMAGLGLGVDLRSVAAAGPRVVAVVLGSLFVLGLFSLGVLRVLHMV